MLDFLDGAIDAVSSAVHSVAEEVMPAAAPTPGGSAAPAGAPDPHHDWVSSVFGVDPRNFMGSAPGGGGSAPGAAKPADDGVFDDLLHIVGLGHRAEREKQVSGAVDKLSRMKEEDIEKLSTDERLKLLEDLRANGTSPLVSGMQKRLYNNTPIDPAQQAVDAARSDAVAKELAGDKELQRAQEHWATLSDEEKAAALKKVVAAQSKAMGVSAPEIVVEHGLEEDGMTVSGVYRDEDGKLHLNMDKGSMTSDFPQAVSIATHENTHHYQAELVKRLENGTLQPGDPEYDQARLFRANNAPGGYVSPGDQARTEEEKAEAVKTYQSQPVERHAWNNGSATARKVDGALKTARGVQDFPP